MMYLMSTADSFKAPQDDDVPSLALDIQGHDLFVDRSGLRMVRPLPVLPQSGLPII